MTQQFSSNIASAMLWLSNKTKVGEGKPIVRRTVPETRWNFVIASNFIKYWPDIDGFHEYIRCQCM